MAATWPLVVIEKSRSKAVWRISGRLFSGSHPEPRHDMFGLLAVIAARHARDQEQGPEAGLSTSSVALKQQSRALGTGGQETYSGRRLRAVVAATEQTGSRDDAANVHARTRTTKSRLFETIAPREEPARHSVTGWLRHEDEHAP